MSPFLRQTLAIAFGICLAVCLCIGGCVFLATGVLTVAVVNSGWPSPSPLAEFTAVNVAELKGLIAIPNGHNVVVTHFWNQENMPNENFGIRPSDGYKIPWDGLIRTKIIDNAGNVKYVIFYLLDFNKDKLRSVFTADSAYVPSQYQ